MPVVHKARDRRASGRSCHCPCANGQSLNNPLGAEPGWYLDASSRRRAVLHIFLRVIEAHLRASIPTASPRARLGAVSFVHRFGSALNRHVHFGFSRCARPSGAQIRSRRIRWTACSIPAKTARSASPVTAAEMAAITEQVRRRVRDGSPAAVCSSPRKPATCSAGRMAASRWMRQCALLARIAPVWSDCCATVPARPSRWSASSRSTHTSSSTTCPSRDAMGARPWCSARWS